MNTIHMIIKGKVQGVGFRYYTYIMAKKYDIKGSVKNLEDGDVEIFAQGDTDKIKKFKKFIYKGSPFSKVERVIEEEINTKEYNDFDLIY